METRRRAAVLRQLGEKRRARRLKRGGETHSSLLSEAGVASRDFALGLGWRCRRRSGLSLESLVKLYDCVVEANSLLVSVLGGRQKEAVLSSRRLPMRLCGAVLRVVVDCVRECWPNTKAPARRQ